MNYQTNKLQMKANKETEQLKDDIISACNMADDVDFLNNKEKLHYTSVLVEAMQWGRKKDRENKEYFSKSHLIDKYNV
jgi:hypothetical protein